MRYNHKALTALGAQELPRPYYYRVMARQGQFVSVIDFFAEVYESRGFLMPKMTLVEMEGTYSVVHGSLRIQWGRWMTMEPDEVLLKVCSQIHELALVKIDQLNQGKAALHPNRKV